MKIKILPLIALLFIQSILLGQSTQAFKYQAVARDASGYPIINLTIGIQIKIFTLNGGNQENYIENHFATSNSFGLVNLEIGRGEIVEGIFENISWGNGNQFIEISIDVNGGTDFVLMGSSEILSVPMANYAAIAGNVVDTSATNELQKLSLSQENVLTIAPEGNSVYLGVYDQSDEIIALTQKVQTDSVYFEGELQSVRDALDMEVARAMQSESDLMNLISENTMNILNDSIYFQELIDNLSNNDDSLYFQIQLNDLLAKIISDSAFLKSLIDLNAYNIQQEITRAILAEALMYNDIVENTANILLLQNKVVTDSMYLKGLIDQNTQAILAETTRAIMAELLNANNIAANAQAILVNQQNILEDSTIFRNELNLLDYNLQEEITRSIYRDEMNSDSVAYLYSKVYNDSIHFQNQINGIAGLDPTLENGKIFVGNSSNVATGVFVSGDAQLLNTGSLIISPSAITTSKIANGNVTNSKLEKSYITIADNSGNSKAVNLGDQFKLVGSGNTTITLNTANNTYSILSSDNQTLTLNGTDLSISAGNTIDMSGFVGAQGSAGPAGPQGPVGPQGPSGVGISSTVNNGNGTFTITYTNGTTFTTANFTGSAGPQGPVGPQGAIGPQGAQGVGITSTTNNGNGTFTLNYSNGTSYTTPNFTGPQGPVGAVGPQGLVGPQGAQGVGLTSTTDNGDGTFTLNYSDGSSFTTADFTGPQGLVGAAGPQGAQGLQGNVGPQGAQGIQGSVGPVGPQGLVGPQGAQGVGILTSVDNNDGTFTLNYSDGSSFTTSDFTGPQGDQGIAGPQGIQGIQGVAGPQGAQGPIGPQGAIGPDGSQGDAGVGVASTVNNGNGTFTITYTDATTFTSVDLTGSTGPAGAQGPQGIQGIQGIQGAQGDQGDQGLQGLAGTNGISINWLGTIFPAPGSPSLNDAYRDPVTRKAYIWDGSSWEIIVEDGLQGPNGPQGEPGDSMRDCPIGSWSEINEEFCIEVNERVSTDWWNANKNCGDLNAHICSWNEWYYACQKPGNGTINMTNDWEWTIVGIAGGTATTVGNGDCKNSSTETMTNSKTYRCCFSR